MPTVDSPLAGGGPDASHHAETVTGQRRLPSTMSSPNPKGDRETQQSKKRAKSTTPSIHPEELEDVEILDVRDKEMVRNALNNPEKLACTSGTGAARRLFSYVIKTDVWYVADSDSEDVAEAMRQDGRD
ncbi:unnamed protein product [Linum trigynum]|uniref:Uncharacterized protein n=1 Tax=Linum trigynum TaxID=586398 RepID=A0AAV2G9G5_9ROSI